MAHFIWLPFAERQMNDLQRIFRSQKSTKFHVLKGIIPPFEGGIQISLSSAHHPVTNREAKTNQMLQHYLRCYCTYSQDNWNDPVPGLTQEAPKGFTCNLTTGSHPGAIDFSTGAMCCSCVVERIVLQSYKKFADFPWQERLTNAEEDNVWLPIKYLTFSQPC